MPLGFMPLPPSQTSAEPSKSSTQQTNSSQGSTSTHNSNPNSIDLAKLLSTVLGGASAQGANRDASSEEVRFPRRITDPTASQGVLQPRDTLEPPDVYRTGTELADKGLGCEPVGNRSRQGPCFLDPKQRGHILSTYLGRVGAAHTEYMNALREVQVEELLRKNPEQSEWMFELFLDVIGLVLTSTVKKAIKQLTGATDELASVVSDHQRAINEISAATEGTVSGLISGAVTRGRVIANQQQQVHDDKQNIAKTGNLSLLALLGVDASARYQYLRESTPAEASDTQLLILAKALEPTNGHRMEDYARELRDKLKRFQTTKLSLLGITNNKVRPLGGDPENPENSWRKATAAFWVKTPIGTRLALYRRRYEAPPETVITRNMISRTATSEDVERFKRQDLRDSPYQFWKYVPGEFVSAAVQMHLAKWGSEPEEHALGSAEFQAMAWDQ